MKLALKDGERVREVEARRVADRTFELTIDGQKLELRAETAGPGFVRLESGGSEVVACVTRAGRRRFVTMGGRDFVLEQVPAGSGARPSSRVDRGPGEISMPMPGLVIQVNVRDGERVARGQSLLVVEAMKMEHTLRAPRDGTVTKLAAEPGKLIDAGAVLLEIGE